MFQAELTAKRLFCIIGMRLRLQELQEEDGQAQRIKQGGQVWKEKMRWRGILHEEKSYIRPEDHQY